MVGADDRTAYLLDRLALQDLVIDYSHGLDLSDEEELFASLWTSDAIWEFPQVKDLRMNGLDEILTFYRMRRAKPRKTHHLVSNLSVRIDGDHATGRCKAWTSGVNNPHFASYEDEYVREDGRWKFKRRSVASSLDAAELPDITKPEAQQQPRGA